MDDFSQMLMVLPSFWQTVIWTLLAIVACIGIVAVLVWTSGMEDT